MTHSTGVTRVLKYSSYTQLLFVIIKVWVVLNFNNRERYNFTETDSVIFQTSSRILLYFRTYMNRTRYYVRWRWVQMTKSGLLFL